MDFLPPNYQSPSVSKYFKPAVGDSRIRILSAPILGWEDWKFVDELKAKEKKLTGDKNIVLQKEPVRYFYTTKKPSLIDAEANDRVKLFWAMGIWSYDFNQMLIWMITQVKIIKDLESLIKDQMFGVPFYYDLRIKRTGLDKNTDYQILALNKSDLPQSIKNQIDKTPFSLEAIYTNKDPFDCDRDTANRTKTYYELENDTPKISRDQAMQIETSIKDEEFRSDLLLQFGIAQGKGRSLDTFYELKEFYLESCLKQIQEKNLS